MLSGHGDQRMREDQTVGKHEFEPVLPELGVGLSSNEVWRFLRKAGVDVDFATANRFHDVLVSLSKHRREEPDWFKERSPAPSDGLQVIVPKIPIASFCSHHLLPWVGYVTVSYTPGEFILGLSKFKRIVDYCSEGLTIQERVTKDVHEVLSKALGVPILVEIKAMHTCAIARGVTLDPGFEFITRIEE